MTSNGYIPVKITFGSSTVMFFVCERIQLLCVVFCVVSCLNKFDFRLVINEKITTPRSDRVSCF